MNFKPYSLADKDACLVIFDANCPTYFAPNERPDYERFLGSEPKGYELCLSEGRIVGAYGLIGSGSIRRSLNWILLSPQAQGSGIGTAIMKRALDRARVAGLALIDIAASHLSEPFFAKHGAVKVRETKDGWGPGMHRIDMELHLSIK